MVDNRRRVEAVGELEAALENDGADEKNYHIRQALQLLELAEEPSPEDAES